MSVAWVVMLLNCLGTESLIPRGQLSFAPDNTLYVFHRRSTTVVSPRGDTRDVRLPAWVAELNWTGTRQLSPDGQRFLIAGPAFVGLYAFDDGVVGDAVWRGKGPVTTAAFSPDGRAIALGRMDGTVDLVDAATGDRQDCYRAMYQAESSMNPNSAVGIGDIGGLTWSPGGRYLVAWKNYGGSCSLIDLKEDCEFRFAPATIFPRFAFSTDEQTLYSFVGRSGAAAATSTTDAGSQWLPLPESWVGAGTAIALAPRTNLLIVAGEASIEVWDLDRCACVELIDAPSQGSTADVIAISPDETRFAVSRAGRIEVYPLPPID